MAKRTILKLGDPALTMKSEPVAGIDADIRTLVRDMIETLHKAPGIGLAAPQVDVRKRVVTVDLSIGEDPDALYALINPEIVQREGKCIREEGCLSVPEVYEKVARPQKVVVKGLNLEGSEVTIEAEDMLARVFCHEIDHLDGKLFVDYLSPLKRSLIRKKFKKPEAKKKA
ncbi:MAG: peptide deformylase [Acidobacteriota bacterium]|nr:peptide deformylase [Acidobacteriota bacterium]